MFPEKHIIAVILMLSVAGSIALGAADVEPDMYWIFFQDKGLANEAELESALWQAEQQLLPQAARRRALVLTGGRLVDRRDLPVCREYVSALRGMGIRPRVVSKWLNAVSAALDEERYRQVQALDFVGKVRLMARSRHDPEPVERDLPPAVDDSALYGLSWEQAALVNLPPVHDMGYNGASVLIGILDSGFNNLPHQCFDSLHVVATWDFVNGDSNVANHGDIGDGSHGTKTLSVLAGYAPGNLVGPAWGADFVLAKTENTEEEEPYEEDLWVAGLEWADSLGARVISSSLSYMDWYTYEDMDGNTAVTTIAADAAVSRGIAVFNSNGNIRGAYDKMRAPADGDSVMGIGAVRSDSGRSYFSSYGPTYDGRIKPDLMAMGSGVRVASPYTAFDYYSSSGTSFSCPMSAGIGALLAQVNPYLTPFQVYQALKETADQAVNPDTVYGWGIINALEAVNWVIASVPRREVVPSPLSFRLSDPYPNPFNSSVRVELSSALSMPVKVAVYDILGRKVADLFEGQVQGGSHQVLWRPEGIASGCYWVRARTPVGMQTVSVIYVR
jgi:serine protease AprX